MSGTAVLSSSATASDSLLHGSRFMWRVYCLQSGWARTRPCRTHSIRAWSMRMQLAGVAGFIHIVEAGGILPTPPAVDVRGTPEAGRRQLPPAERTTRNHSDNSGTPTNATYGRSTRVSWFSQHTTHPGELGGGYGYYKQIRN